MEKKELIRNFFALFIVVTCDQLIKYALIRFEFFTIVINSDTALNILRLSNNSLIYIISIILIAVLIYAIKFEESNLSRIILFILIGAGCSNLLDRIFRDGVVDYVSIFNLPIFNLADLVITLCISLTIIKKIFYNGDKKVLS